MIKMYWDGNRPGLVLICDEKHFAANYEGEGGAWYPFYDSFAARALIARFCEGKLFPIKGVYMNLDNNHALLDAEELDDNLERYLAFQMAADYEQQGRTEEAEWLRLLAKDLWG